MLAALIAAAADGPEALYLRESAIQHAPLVTRPEKIIMMGFNYRRHAAETGTPIPANPTLFNKFNTALNHHGGTIKLPASVAKQFHYEIELVIVFGRDRFTGAPHGVIFGKPKAAQVWLKPGDRISCSVEKLGELAFTLA